MLLVFVFVSMVQSCSDSSVACRVVSLFTCVLTQRVHAVPKQHRLLYYERKESVIRTTDSVETTTLRTGRAPDCKDCGPRQTAPDTSTTEFINVFRSRYTDRYAARWSGVRCRHVG